MPSSGEPTAQQLRRLEAVADPDLDGRGADELVDRMLTRLQEVIEADTATVLLVDRSGTTLVAHAAHGVEEEVRQGARVPIGVGFAGRIAATRSPLILDEVTDRVVANPILLRKHLRSLVGVPLLNGDAVLGVLHVGRVEGRTFDDQDVAVLELAGERIAGAITTEQMTTDRATARLLQQSLLPARLPSVAGLEFASRFVPAATVGVGGDWYDAFVLPDGRVGIVMGDVVGKGLAAAVVMGRLRSALRAYALEWSSPAAVLGLLDAKATHFEAGQLATVLYLTISADRTSITASSAGHPPPLLAHADSGAGFLDCRPSPPIGFSHRDEHLDITASLAPGTTVACYTDGLVERRDRPIDERLDLLRRTVVAGPVDAVCADVMSELIGSHAVEDDTALLLVRRTD